MMFGYPRPNLVSLPLLASLVPLLFAGTGGCRSLIDTSAELPYVAQQADDLAVAAPADQPSAEAEVSPDTVQAGTAQVEAAEKILSPTVVQESKNALRPKRVASRGWYCETGIPVYLAVATRQPRWRHASLESLLAEGETVNVLSAGIHSQDPEVAATALVGLIRLGDPPSTQVAATMLRKKSLTPSTQAALLEALASLQHPEAAALIESLFDERETWMAQVDGDVPLQLQQQVWISLAVVSPACRQDPRFWQDFAHHPAEIQATSLDLMLLDRSHPLPENVSHHFADASPEALRRLGLWHAYLRSVAPLEVLLRHARAAEFRTRESAVIGLGREGSTEAQEALQAIHENDPTLIQVAAVVAWGLIGQHDQWPRLAQASSWRVRQAAAQWIPLTTENQVAIEALQNDKSHVVQQTLAQRHEERAESHVSSTVKQTSFADGSDNAIGQVDDPPEITAAEAIEILQSIEIAQWGETRAQKETARRRLNERRVALLSTLDQAAQQLAQYDNAYLFEELLPEIDVRYRWLLEAASENPQLSGQALRKLAAEAKRRSLPPLVLWRLAHNHQAYQQAQWQTVLDLIADDGRPPARALAAAALQYDSPQVQILACRYLARFPAPQAASDLRGCLEHSAPALRAAAIEALASLPLADKSDTLARCLADSSTEVQLAAAVALDRAGDRRGLQHLERLTYAESRQTRLQAAQAIAARDEIADLTPLIRLLDDETSIRLAALAGLERVVPPDQVPVDSGAERSLDARCEAWKRWFQRQTQPF